MGSARSNFRDSVLDEGDPIPGEGDAEQVCPFLAHSWKVLGYEGHVSAGSRQRCRGLKPCGAATHHHDLRPIGEGIRCTEIFKINDQGVVPGLLASAPCREQHAFGA